MEERAEPHFLPLLRKYYSRLSLTDLAIDPVEFMRPNRISSWTVSDTEAIGMVIIGIPSGF